MVEIFTLGWYADKIAALAQAKGLRGPKYRLLAQLFWCLGEALGLFAGLAMAPAHNPLSLIMIYLCALMGAALGSGLAYAMVRAQKPELQAIV